MRLDNLTGWRWPFWQDFDPAIRVAGRSVVAEIKVLGMCATIDDAPLAFDVLDFLGVGQLLQGQLLPLNWESALEELL
jgi:hypothetical protein